MTGRFRTADGDLMKTIDGCCVFEQGTRMASDVYAPFSALKPNHAVRASNVRFVASVRAEFN